MPDAIRQNDATRPTKDSKNIALNEWSAAIEAIVFMVPPFFVPKRANGET